MQLGKQKPQQSVSQLLVVSLVLLVVSVVSGCARGPKVERCISDGDAQRLSMDCFDPRVDMPNGYVRHINDAENYLCIHPAAEERLLKACVEGRPTQFSFCVVSASEFGAWCVDSSNPLDDGYFLMWFQMQNFVCTSPSDMERLLKWCIR